MLKQTTDHLNTIAAVEQTVVGAVFKSLKAQQHQLGIKVPDVKSCISLSLLSEAELSSGFGLAAKATLASQGWFALEQQHMIQQSLWDLDPAKMHTMQSIKIHAAACMPDRVALKVETGQFCKSQPVKPLQTAYRD